VASVVSVVRLAALVFACATWIALASCSTTVLPSATAERTSAGDGGGSGPARDDGAAPLPDGGAEPAFEQPRATVDQSDDQPGAYQVHVLYVEPGDRVASPALDTNGSIRRSIHAMQTWLAARTGGPKLRFDTYQGALDITFVKLALSEAALAYGSEVAGPEQLRDRLEAALAGFADPSKIYLVFYDGLSFGTCGNSPLPGRMPILYIGGVWSSSFLTRAAPAAATSLTVYDPARLDLPSPPFAATLGSETVTVSQIAGTSATLGAPLVASHGAGELLMPTQRPSDCRNNPRSVDGESIGYEDFAALHELMHAIGIVSSTAPHHAAPPVAHGHLDESSAAGTADLMYQGGQAWGCSVTSASAATSPCQLDPGHESYFALPSGSPLADLAKSVFLDPAAPDAVLPPGL
jgi:hypothetical protein